MNQLISRTGSRGGSRALWMLLIVSTALNGVLSQRLRSASAHEASGIGKDVPSIQAVTHDAVPITIGYESQTLPTILYYFSPTCRWCERNWRSVAALERATRGRYRFVAITTGDDSARREHAGRLPIPTYWGLSESQRRAHEFSGTPHTLVVSKEGRVLQSWRGAYTNGTKTDLERYFQLSLPDVARSNATR